MNSIGSRRRTSCQLASTGLAVLLSALIGSSIASDATRDLAAGGAQTTKEEAAARYVTNLRRLLETEIVPSIKGGILNTAASRPPALTVEVTNDPSSYSVGAKVGPDGSLIVRLSIGYLTMHDAALDAVALSAVLQRPSDLRRYLMYQLRLANENDRRRARGLRTQHAVTFAEFVGLDPGVALGVFAQPQQRLSRNRVQVESLGWVVAYLLVRADPKLAGFSSSTAALDGAGAARLARASGWFPVPPVATALGIAAIERSAGAAFDERALLCRAARLIEAGVVGMSTDTKGGSEADRDAGLKRRVAEIRAQIAGMRRDGRCAPDGTVLAVSTVPSLSPAKRVRAGDRVHESGSSPEIHEPKQFAGVFLRLGACMGS